MKIEWRKLAPWGLYLAILAALVSLGLYIVYQTWGLPLQISVGLIVVGLALFGALDPDRVRVIFTGREARNSGNLIVMVAAFLGILVVINYLVFQAAKLYPDRTRWDLTENKDNTLAAESLDVLGRLPQPVKALGFYTKSVSTSNADSILLQYQADSKGQFSYEFIDPDEKPAAAKAAGVPQGKDGVVVLQMGERHELVENVTEQEITNGLIRLLSDESRAVYFLTGHGERSPDDTGDTSYSQLKQTLQDKNYTVKILDLRSTGVIPEDARLVVVAGSTKPVSTDEVTLLSDFSAKGGALMVLSDPLIQTEFGDASDPLAEYLASSWGAQLGNDLVIQVATNKPSPYITGVQLANHAIVAQLQNNPPLFLLARSIQRASSEATNGNVTELVQSTPFFDNCYPYCSWASTNMTDVVSWLSGNQTAPANPTSTDLLGPVTLAAAYENGTTKLVVFGDSDFAANSYLNTYGNADLIVNAVDWAVGQENLINLTPKNTTQRILIAPSNLQMTSNLLLLGLVLVIPGLVILAGLLNWFSRRQRG